MFPKMDKEQETMNQGHNVVLYGALLCEENSNHEATSRAAWPSSLRTKDSSTSIGMTTFTPRARPLATANHDGPGRSNHDPSC